MTRAELETRRLEALPELLNPHISLAKIAEPLGVTRTTVARWRAAALTGRPLTARKATGRPPILNSYDEARVRRFFETSTADGKRWTQEAFADKVHVLIGYRFSQDHMGKIMHRLGLIEQKREYGRNRK